MRFLAKDVFIGCALSAAALLMLGAADDHHNAELITETYTVQSGDTLWDISGKYMQKNTYGPRDIREFYQGIIELNYDEVFAKRANCVIYPGDKLKINYWIKKG